MIAVGTFVCVILDIDARAKLFTVTDPMTDFDFVKWGQWFHSYGIARRESSASAQSWKRGCIRNKYASSF